ncbi:MAG: 6-phosphogluconolactonase [Candidatus Acidiferrum sp.]
MAAASQRDVRILHDGKAITAKAADEFVTLAVEGVDKNGSFTVALSGGSTPKSLYAMLAEDAKIRVAVPWSKIHFFFGDERHVPPDHSESNFRMVNEAMFSRVPVPEAQITRIRGEYPDTEKAALEYEEALRAYFKVSDGEYPRFDLVLLGMGEEGHTASLFPGTKALHAANRIVVRNWVGKLYTERITLTAPAINEANQVIFLVTRADKAPALKAVLEGPYEPEQLPAQLIQPIAGKVLWLVDEAAGSMLTTGIRE